MIQLDGQTIYVSIIALGGLCGVITFGWMSAWWLRDQLQKVVDTVNRWMDVHESEDQRRHEENIVRFAKIEAKLDVAIQNGKH